MDQWSNYDNVYSYSDAEYIYTGVFYDFNWNGAFFEIGLTAGTGDFNSPQVLFQIGYVYRAF